jgi:hypothetical protein
MIWREQKSHTSTKERTLRQVAIAAHFLGSDGSALVLSNFGVIRGQIDCRLARNYA